MVENKFNFEDLRVYQLVLELVDRIYELTKNWPREEVFGLTNQLRRAVVSILLNIAEGSSRTKKDFKHFLDLSRGSVYECIASLQIALNQNYINQKVYVDLYDKLRSVSKMISALKRSIK